MPSNRIRVPHSSLLISDAAFRSYRVNAAGPIPFPNTVTNSPGETAPAWKLAALVTPPGFTAGRCCAVTVTVTVARFESGPPLDEA